MKKYNYIVSVIMMAIAGYVFYETSQYTIGSSGQKNPAVWPQTLAVFLLILAVLLIVETIFKKDPEEEARTEKVIDWGSTGMKRVYMMIGTVALFVILMQFIGMLFALLVTIPLMEAIMGCKKWYMYIIIPVAMVGFCYLFFVVIMQITLPQPFWA